MNQNQIIVNPIRWLSRSLLVILLFLSQNTNVQAQQEEYTMKAVAFEKISMFITWPDSTFNKSSNEFVIIVFGQNPFGDILENVYKDKKIKNKKVKVLYTQKTQLLSSCQLLFISKTDPFELQKILNHVKGKPMLIISDTEGFAEAGCHINFYEYENKLRFELNHKSLIDAGFSVDYRLLRVSKVLNPVTE